MFAALIGSFYGLGLESYLDLAYIQSNRVKFLDYYEANTAITLSSYFILYVAIAALSLPGATIMTLLGAALFGFTTALALISFASTIGATIAFLSARFLFRDFIQNRFGDKLEGINRGLEKEGAFYLFSLRLIPILPFVIINLLCGLSKIPTKTFYWVSQLGMLPGTMVYIFAGAQIGEISSPSDIASPKLIAAFALLGIFPIATKKILERINAR
jgi:uncharacterized membrane protein YdjX (TVP38/TMEM64 family)